MSVLIVKTLAAKAQSGSGHILVIAGAGRTHPKYDHAKYHVEANLMFRKLLRDVMPDSLRAFAIIRATAPDDYPFPLAHGSCVFINHPLLTTFVALENEYTCVEYTHNGDMNVYVVHEDESQTELYGCDLHSKWDVIASDMLVIWHAAAIATNPSVLHSHSALRGAM